MPFAYRNCYHQAQAARLRCCKKSNVINACVAEWQRAVDDGSLPLHNIQFDCYNRSFYNNTLGTPWVISIFLGSREVVPTVRDILNTETKHLQRDLYNYLVEHDRCKAASCMYKVGARFVPFSLVDCFHDRILRWSSRVDGFDSSLIVHRLPIAIDSLKLPQPSSSPP